MTDPMDAPAHLEDRIVTREVAARIRTDGYCFLEALLAEETVERLLSEFDAAFRQPPRGVSIRSLPPGPRVFVDPRVCRPGALPTIFSVLSSPRLESIAESILPAGSRVHERIVLTHDTAAAPITDLHFDSQRALKLLVYLLDTDESNGAFGYVRGSHLANTAYREEFLSRGGHLLELENVAAEREQERLALDRLAGPAGSMILFDTDGWHSAGRLADGARERKVIRARSRFAGQEDLWPRRLSPMWFRRVLGLFPPQPPIRIPDRHRTAGTSRKV